MKNKFWIFTVMVAFLLVSGMPSYVYGMELNQPPLNSEWTNSSTNSTMAAQPSTTTDGSATTGNNSTSAATIPTTSSPQTPPTASIAETTAHASPATTSQAQKAAIAAETDQDMIDQIGKGDQFKGKLYLTYIRDKITTIFQQNTGNNDQIIIKLGLLLLDQTLANNVKKRFDVDPLVIKHLISTALLYDIAFAKESNLMHLINQTSDGTAPVTPSGFYPNTSQLVGTALNNQDGQMMTLKAYYVDQKSDKTVIIHSGFRGNWHLGIVTAEYDEFYKAGYNLLFVDSRATGASGGEYVTYGEYESDDVLYWINREVADKPQQKILLYGGSMGAATVMSTLAKDVPNNVKGIIENCGFQSIDAQLRYTYRSVVAPQLSSLGSMVDLDIVADQAHEDLCLGLLKEYYLDQELNMHSTENLPQIGMAKNLPKLLIHGDQDEIVPVSNAYSLYHLSGGYKKMLIVAGAGHGQAQIVDPIAYYAYIANFLTVVFNDQVFVKYVAENNQSLLTSETLVLQGAYGERYQTQAKVFKGYELIKVTGATEGYFKEMVPTIVYHYQKIATGDSTGTPANSEPTHNKNNLTQTPINFTPQPQQSSQALPKTGTTHSLWLNLLGAVVLAGWISIWKYKGREDNVNEQR